MNRSFSDSRFKVELGIKGENLAGDFLKSAGYKILKRNLRIGHSDIDILARKNGVTVFVEVRTRTGGEMGMPEESLTAGKLRQMKKTAETYMTLNRITSKARIDAVCIVLDDAGRIKHFRHYLSVC